MRTGDGKRSEKGCDGEPSHRSRINHTGIKSEEHSWKRFLVPRDVARVVVARSVGDTTLLRGIFREEWAGTIFRKECSERSSRFQDLWSDKQAGWIGIAVAHINSQF